MKLFSWLLLLLTFFFTFLTAYAYLTGKVRECGCFGDCIPLSAGESFVKDLVLLVLVVFLFAMRSHIGPILKPSPSAGILILSALLAFSFQWHVLVHLPVVDCLPYRVGNNISEKMKPPPGAIPDSTVITMVYDHNGRKVEFDATHFPRDFDDSYHFVNRYDKLIRKGNAEPPIKDFVLTTGGGTDTTQTVLEAKGYKLFEFIRELSRRGDFGVILTMAKSKHIPVYIITADYDNVASYLQEDGIAGDVTLLKCDATAIKTAARANPTLYLIHGATVKDKWSYADFDKAVPAVNELPSQQ